MTNKTRKTKIKDCEYTISLLDGDSLLNGFGVLAKYAGGPIGLLLSAGAVGDSPQLVGDALRELGQAMSAPDMRGLVFQLLEGSLVSTVGGQPMPLIKDGNKELFKAHFTGKIGEILQLSWFALRENYAGFSDALPGFTDLVQRLKSQDPLGSNSPQGTTGASPG